MAEKTVTHQDFEALSKQVSQAEAEISELKQALAQLQADLGLGEADNYEDGLKKDETFEFATLTNDVIKGRINWTNAYLISVTTDADENGSPAEVLIFKHALAYIRKPEKRHIPRRGMYV